MGILDLFRRRPASSDARTLPGEPAVGSSERGQRSTPESQTAAAYRRMWVDTALRATILDIRTMDRLDGRVKKIHLRTARAAAKGGLKLQASGQPAWLQREWDRYLLRLHLDRREKLESDLRGLMMEGNLPLQWVLDEARRNVIAGVRMPAETLVPQVTESGIFADPAKAYVQMELSRGLPAASFALWQLTVARLTPDNYDDWGSLGRPYLDAARPVWKKLDMTEEDLVIRRRMRAPLRMAHFLEGATTEELNAYRLQVEQDQAHGAVKDYYSNRKGAVATVQGDANLDQIADVVHLLDNFFYASPAPKELFGHSGQLSRDVLEELRKDFFDEVDAMQDTAAWCYEQGFRLQLLLADRDPDAYDFWVEFAERRTDTPNQRADLALKLQALGLPRSTVWEATGIDVAAAERAREQEAAQHDPAAPGGLDTVPPPGGMQPSGQVIRPRVAITPGNARSGDSATTISTRSGS